LPRRLLAGALARSARGRPHDHADCACLRSRTLDGGPEATANRAWLAGQVRLPRVDVLITTYNEEEPTLTRTIVGAMGIDFPGLRTWVLDDGRWPWVEQLCHSKNVCYLTRADKAGNINHALEVIHHEPDPPEFIVLVDADFVPQSSFLWHTMPLFHDETVGLVQTTQHFFNNDPIQSNLLIGNVWPEEQRFSFDHLMPSKDARGAAFCCGTSLVIRMQALEAIGGFPAPSSFRISSPRGQANARVALPRIVLRAHHRYVGKLEEAGLSFAGRRRIPGSFRRGRPPRCASAAPERRSARREQRRSTARRTA
jgi:cellulose synthase/poly-beta-1,6-N-acetylglucosamine synthase-like glycosyltransferase